MGDKTGAGGAGPHLLTTEMLREILTARDPPRSSYSKLRDPKPFEGDKAEFKSFIRKKIES